MSDQPTPDLIRAVRAGCSEIFPDCSFPSESCNRYCVGAIRQLRAALAELAAPSAEMLEAVPDWRNMAEHCWHAMMRRVLGEGGDDAG